MVASQRGDITFVIFARDEARRIRGALRNLRGFGDILIMIDDRTVDATGEIAKAYGARVHKFKNPGWTEGEDVVNLVMGLGKTQWFYWGYADELLAKPLLEKMREFSRQDRFKVVWIRRRNYNYGGVNLENGPALRFFRREAIDFRGNEIGRFGKIAVPPEEVFSLPMTDAYSIHHFSTYDLTKFELAHSKYSSEEAKANIRLGRHFSGVKLILKPLYYFLRYMIVGGAWRWGWRGFIIAANYAFFFFNTQAKMWEIENNVNLETIEKTYEEMKEKLLDDFPPLS